MSRIIIASSTAVYGGDAPSGQPARVLSEVTPVDPQDVYELSKVAAELILQVAVSEAGVDAVALRFGRFFFPSHAAYHLRKLSTGVDVHDACQAIALCLVRRRLPRFIYCVASDLDLTYPQRQRLGLDARAVLDEALPGFMAVARRRRLTVPPRVGKSVDTAAIRTELGFVPERSLEWAYRLWAGMLAQRQQARLTPPIDVLSDAYAIS